MSFAPLALLLTLGLIAGPAASEPEQLALETAADSPSKPVAPASSEDDPDDPTIDDDEFDEAARDSFSEPPPGVEILRIRGRGIGAFETEVPESVTHFDAATIEALGAQNIADLARVTPNVEIVTGSATQSTFFIRGIGLADFSSNAAGAVAIFQDGVSLNAPPLQTGQLFDIQDVQILRGPQAGGPNRNASAGSIRVESRKPTGDFTSSLRVSLGRYDADSEGAFDALIQDYEGALEFPILEESLSARLAFRFHDADPFMTNGCGDAPPFSERSLRITGPGETGAEAAERASVCGERDSFTLPSRGKSQIPTGLPTRVGDEHNWATRAQLRFQPKGTEMDFLLNGHGSRLDQQSTLGQASGTDFLQGGQYPSFGGPTSGAGALGYQEPDQREEWLSLCPALNNCSEEKAIFGQILAETRPFDLRPFRGDYDRVGQTTLDTFGGFLEADIGIGDLHLSVTSAYDRYSRTRDADNDFTPHTLFEMLSFDRAWQVWEEIELSGELEDYPLRWNVGGYFLHEELVVDVLTRLQFETQNFRRHYTQDIWSWAVWGGFSWDFLDDFTLDGAVRYNWERKTFDLARSFPDSPFQPARFSIDEATWQEPTGEISLTYRFSKEFSSYAKYTHGFKAGHFNSSDPLNPSFDQNAPPPDNPPADAELVDAFEIGFGGSWFDNRLTAKGAAFYYLYDNYQIFLFTDTPSTAPTLDVLNAKQAQNFGAEIETRAEPLAGWAPAWLDGLVLNTRLGWLESEFLDFQNLVERRIGSRSIQVTIDFTGNRLPNSPRLTASGSAEWTFDFGAWGSLIPRYDFAWTDDIFFDATNGRGSVDVRGQPNLPEFAVGQPAYWNHDLRLSYRTPTGNVEVSFWVRNLENTIHKNFSFDVSQFQKVVIGFPGDPRTLGFDMSVVF